MTQEKLQEILKNHKLWMDDDTTGERANLRGANLRGAYLSGANLSGADLSGAYLSGAYLNGANLNGAYLSGTNLSGAYLRGANLSGADLSGADLSGAYLNGANLNGAYLRGANLNWAYLNGANLSGAKGVFFIGPIGSRGDFLYSIMWGDGLRFKTGCFWGTQAELEAAITKTHGDNEHARAYRAAIALHMECNK